MIGHEAETIDHLDADYFSDKYRQSRIDRPVDSNQPFSSAMREPDASVDIVAAISKAESAQSAGDWKEAACCWQFVCQNAPNRAVAYIRLGEALCELKRLDEADAILGEALKRFPDNAAMAMRHAEIAQSRGDFTVAANRWQQIRNRFPNRAPVVARMGNALTAMGRFDEADELLGEATAKFKKNEAIAVAYAVAAQRRGHPDEALSRWQAVQERFPDQPEAQAGIEFARRELDEARPVAKSAATPSGESGIAGSGSENPAPTAETPLGARAAVATGKNAPAASGRVRPHKVSGAVRDADTMNVLRQMTRDPAPADNDGHPAPDRSSLLRARNKDGRAGRERVPSQGVGWGKIGRLMRHLMDRGRGR